MSHPARVMPYHELLDGLRLAVSEGTVNEQRGPGGLRQFTYSRSCVYDRQWTPITMLARGLILDIEKESVVATPFSKFFNHGERDDSIPDLPFEVFEKLDGSLAIIFHWEGLWRVATKGSFQSEQAKWATIELAKSDLSALVPGTTYLAEAIYHTNKIVVSYDYEGLVLLSAYDASGVELPYSSIIETATKARWRHAKRYDYESISDLIVHTGSLPPSEEGFVVRFSNGLRLKIKGEEYKRIHRLISHVTPLALWNAMIAGDDLEDLRRQLPEEFWGDFDTITGLLKSKVNHIVKSAEAEAAKVASWADKEVGLHLNEFPADVRRFIFPYRKYGNLLEGKARHALFQAIRPNGNVLPGYVASVAVKMVADEVN